MTLRGARDLSVPILLALLGALLAAGSLLLPWIAFDLAKFQHFMETSPLFAEARAKSGMDQQQMHTALSATMDTIQRQAGGSLNGLHALRLTSIVAQLVSVAVVVSAVARFTNQGIRGRVWRPSCWSAAASCCSGRCGP